MATKFRFKKSDTLTTEEVDTEIKLIWSDLKTDPALQQQAAAAGFDMEQIDGEAECPFEVEETTAGEGIVTGILIGVGTHFAIKGLEKLWIEVIGPYVEQKFGADLVNLGEDKDDAGS